MRHWRKNLALVVAVASLGYVLAIVSLAQGWPPASWVLFVYRHAYHRDWDQVDVDRRHKEKIRVGGQTEHDAMTDPGRVISVASLQDARALRERLVRSIWLQGKPPSGPPDEIIENYKDDPDLNRFIALRKVDKLVSHQELELDVTSYLMWPEQPNGRVFIWHQGTSGFFTTNASAPMIQALLEQGFIVAAISTVGRGTNPQPIVVTDHGPRRIVSPQDFYLLKSKGPILNYFYDPVIEILNLIEQRGYGDGRCVIMGGVSGGAEVTLGVAALDPRICLSFSLSGTYPPFLEGKDVFMDPRETELELVTNLLNLYVLAGLGPERAHYQIANRYDEYFFLNGPGVLQYRDQVHAAIALLGAGGQFVGVLDEVATTHEISPWALDLIVNTSLAFVRSGPRH